MIICERRDIKLHFLSKINKTESCWIWTDYLRPTGYGQFNFNKKKWYAHRFSYELYHGKLEKGDCVCHKCDNPSCVNPDHLFIGTQTDNMKDMNLKNRHAKGENTNAAILTEDQVKDIRIKFKSGVKNKDLCLEYKVSHTTIHRIVYNKLWKHLL